MSAPFCTISVEGVAFSDCCIQRLIVGSFADRAEQKPNAGRHHEQDRDLAEGVEGAVGQQNPGDHVGRAELAWNQIDVGRRERRQRTALAVVYGDGRKDDAEQGDQDDGCTTPHHASLRCPVCARCTGSGRLRRACQNGIRGAGKRMRRDRIGHQHEIRR